MNRDDIIRMARECGLTINDSIMYGVEHFAALVAAAEREACARELESLSLAHPGRADLTVDQCIAAIRARGE